MRKYSDDNVSFELTLLTSGIIQIVFEGNSTINGTKEFIQWIEESLYEHKLTKEALKGILVSGTLGLALLQDLRKHFPTLHFKATPPQTAFKGAQVFLDALYSPQPIQSIRVLEESLYLCSPDWPSRQLINANKSGPYYHTVYVDAAPNGCSLWSQNHRGELTCLGNVSRVSNACHLTITYQGMGEIDAQWTVNESLIESPPSWTWAHPSLWSV